MTLPVVPLRVLASTLLLVFALLLEGGTGVVGKADGPAESVSAAESALPAGVAERNGEDASDGTAQLIVGYIPGSDFMQRGSALAIMAADGASLPHVNLAVLTVPASERAFMIGTFAADPDIVFVQQGGRAEIGSIAQDISPRARVEYGPAPRQPSAWWGSPSRWWQVTSPQR